MSYHLTNIELLKEALFVSNLEIIKCLVRFSYVQSRHEFFFVLSGKNEARLERVWPWSRTVRTIVNGDMFSQYIAAPTKSTVEILNGRDKRIHCSFEHLDSPDQIVYTSTKL